MAAPATQQTPAAAGRGPVYDKKTEAATVARDLADRIRGRVVVITGANGSLGFETARVLCLQGAKVIAVCRSQANADKVAAQIREKQPDADVTPMVADLSSLASVRAFADAFLALNLPLHVLLLNAGIMACPKAKTQDGFESQLGINHLAHFLLTNLLLDKLKATGTAEEPARVVAVSSAANYAFPPPEGILFDDLNADKHYDQWVRYGMSKLANILFAKELQRRMDAEGAHVVANALHPGVIRETGLYRHWDLWNKIQMFSFLRAWTLLTHVRTIEQGAANEVYCSFDPRAGKGEFHFDCAINHESLHEAANNPEIAKRLWTVSEQLVGLAPAAAQ